MTYISTKDFLIEVAKGNVAGHSLVHKFGRNQGVPNGSFEPITELSAALTLPQAATTVRIKAGGNAADTAAGAGAREITVVGLDDTFAEATETIATAGASASSSTTTSFWRVYRAYVSAVGTYEAANTGDITIENSAGTADLNIILAGQGQTQYGLYSIPTGKTGYLIYVHLTVDSNKTASIRCLTRENLDDVSAPMSPKRIRLFYDGIEAPGLQYRPKSPEFSMPAKTDIWFEASGDGAVSEVSTDFEILLVDD